VTPAFMHLSITFTILYCSILLHFSLSVYYSKSHVQHHVPQNLLTSGLKVYKFTTCFRQYGHHQVLKSFSCGNCCLVLLIYEVISESSRTRPKKKCWLNLLNFGCHLIQNSLVGNICCDPIVSSMLLKHHVSHFP
jgi:hypothetical protein